jgi:hypothetical protein
LILSEKYAAMHIQYSLEHHLMLFLCEAVRDRAEVTTAAADESGAAEGVAAAMA